MRAVHQTIQNEFYASAFRHKLYTSLEQLQTDVDDWVRSHNEERAHSEKHCFGKTPWQTFLDSNAIALGKQLGRTMPIAAVAA
jgi:hypothetical protein